MGWVFRWLLRFRSARQCAGIASACDAARFDGDDEWRTMPALVISKGSRNLEYIQQQVDENKPDSSGNRACGRFAESREGLVGLNFIAYDACIQPAFFLYDALQDVRSGRLREGVPDIKWATE